MLDSAIECLEVLDVQVLGIQFDRSTSLPSAPTCNQHAATINRLVQQCGAPRVNFQARGISVGVDPNENGGGEGGPAGCKNWCINNNGLPLQAQSWPTKCTFIRCAGCAECKVEPVVLPDIICTDVEQVDLVAAFGVRTDDAAACPAVAAVLSAFATEHSAKAGILPMKVSFKCVGALLTAVVAEPREPPHTCSDSTDILNDVLRLFSTDHGTQACEHNETPILASDELVTSVTLDVTDQLASGLALPLLVAPAVRTLGSCGGQVTLLNQILHGCSVLDNEAHVAACIPPDAVSLAQLFVIDGGNPGAR